MAIGLIIVVDPQIEPMEWAFFDDDVLTCLFEEDALRTEANALEEFARAEKAGIAIARGFDECSTLTLEAYHLLGEHVTTGL